MHDRRPDRFPFSPPPAPRRRSRCSRQVSTRTCSSSARAPSPTRSILAIELLLPAPGADAAELERAAREHQADLSPAADPAKLDFASMRASMIAISNGKLASKLVNAPWSNRDIFIADASQSFLAKSASSFTTPLSGTLGDRMRVGYGKLTVYLGAPRLGAGKTYAMLDRGAQLAGGRRGRDDRSGRNATSAPETEADDWRPSGDCAQRDS